MRWLPGYLKWYRRALAAGMRPLVRAKPLDGSIVAMRYRVGGSAVKTICTTNCSWWNTKLMVANLCRMFREACLGDGEAFTFPTPGAAGFGFQGRLEGREDISPFFWPNGKVPTCDEWKTLAASDFKDTERLGHTASLSNCRVKAAIFRVAPGQCRSDNFAT